jgi:hypothetical protein
MEPFKKLLIKNLQKKIKKRELNFNRKKPNEDKIQKNKLLQTK